MLIQFAVENYRSFRDKVVFSMLAPEQTVVDGKRCTERAGLKLLRCAALYGANAAGKSNLIRAIDFARKLVIKGTEPSEPVTLNTFKLDPETLQAPSQFEFELLIDNNRYSYGFQLTPEAILAEWLYRTNPTSEEEMVFERAGTPSNPSISAFKFGSMLQVNTERSQFVQFVGQGTRNNQLFLTEAAQRNVYELSSLHDWFRLTLKIMDPSSKYRGIASQADKDPEFRHFLGKFLQQSDTGVTGIKVEHQIEKDELTGTGIIAKLLAHQIISDLFKDYNNNDEELAQKSDKLVKLTLRTEHKFANGQPASFHLNEESDGTQRLLHLAPTLYSMTNEPVRVSCVDELDRSLHPLMTRRFVSDFLQNEQLQSEQLIFTTHDTNLLSREVLPLESIWFVEKDQQGASHLYPLSDFKKDQLEQLSGSLEAGYLHGRFGAIPFFADRERLGWFNDGES